MMKGSKFKHLISYSLLFQNTQYKKTEHPRMTMTNRLEDMNLTVMKHFKDGSTPTLRIYSGDAFMGSRNMETNISQFS